MARLADVKKFKQRAYLTILKQAEGSGDLYMLLVAPRA